MYVPYEMFTLPVVLKLHDSASSNFKFSCIITEEYYNFYDLTEGPCLLTILVVYATETEKILLTQTLQIMSCLTIFREH